MKRDLQQHTDGQTLNENSKEKTMEYTVHELIQMIPRMAEQYQEEIKRLPGASVFKTAARFFEYMSREIEESEISEDTWMTIYYTMNSETDEDGWREVMNCDIFFRNPSGRSSEVGTAKIIFYYEMSTSKVKAKAVYEFQVSDMKETRFTGESHLGKYCDEEVTWAERMTLECLNQIASDLPWLTQQNEKPN